MDMLAAIADALTPINLILALGGIVLGTIVGALPGLSATMAVAVLVPFTFTMPPASALIALGSIYTGAIYGGAFSAILVNTPGTPSSIATTFDGYPMAKRGDGNLAVTLATLSSVVGGLFGALTLLLLAPPLALIALAFGPPEYFWLAVLGLTLISALSADNILKGLIGGCFGLMLAMVGVAVVGGDIRFTLDTQVLLGGVSLIPALIGLYCIPVLIDLVASPDEHLKVQPERGGYRLKEAALLMWRSKVNTIRGSVIGTVVGILPGAGGSIACLVSYAEARRASKHPERYGKGEPDGVIATETANNATVGGGFIPTLVLGIPGTPPDAIILGALLVQGIKVGPSLFTDQAGIVYTFIYGLLFATILMLPAGLLLGRYAYQSIIATPKSMLVPVVALMTVIGAFAIHNNSDDIVLMVVLGLLGWVLDRAGFSPSPIVLGLVLGQIAEQGFVQSYLIGNAQNNLVGMYFGRPISLAIAIFAVLTLFYPFVASRWRIKKSAGEGRIVDSTAAERRTRDLPGIIFAFLFAAIGGWVILESRTLSALGSVFPITIAVAMIVCSLILIGGNLLRPAGDTSGSLDDGLSTPRRLALATVMLLWALLMSRAGFVLSSIVAFFLLLLIAEYDRWTPRRALVQAGIGIAFVALSYLLMRDVLLIPVPDARFF
jgi:putative tricarboxylic transport membrane protein